MRYCRGVQKGRSNNASCYTGFLSSHGAGPACHHIVITFELICSEKSVPRVLTIDTFLGVILSACSTLHRIQSALPYVVTSPAFTAISMSPGAGRSGGHAEGAPAGARPAGAGAPGGPGGSQGDAGCAAGAAAGPAAAAERRAGAAEGAAGAGMRRGQADLQPIVMAVLNQALILGGGGPWFVVSCHTMLQILAQSLHGYWSAM